MSCELRRENNPLPKPQYSQRMLSDPSVQSSPCISTQKSLLSMIKNKCEKTWDSMKDISLIKWQKDTVNNPEKTSTRIPRWGKKRMKRVYQFRKVALRTIYHYDKLVTSPRMYRCKHSNIINSQSSSHQFLKPRLEKTSRMSRVHMFSFFQIHWSGSIMIPVSSLLGMIRCR